MGTPNSEIGPQSIPLLDTSAGMAGSDEPARRVVNGIQVD